MSPEDERRPDDGPAHDAVGETSGTSVAPIGEQIRAESDRRVAEQVAARQRRAAERKALRKAFAQRRFAGLQLRHADKRRRS